jgi:hypothetical protein
MTAGVPNADQRNGGSLAAVGRRSSPVTNTHRPDATEPSTYTFDPKRHPRGASGNCGTKGGNDMPYRTPGYHRFRVLSFGFDDDQRTFSVYDTETDTVYEKTTSEAEAWERATARESAERNACIVMRHTEIKA